MLSEVSVARNKFFALFSLHASHKVLFLSLNFGDFVVMGLQNCLALLQSCMILCFPL